jgi:hypothetical protein
MLNPRLRFIDSLFADEPTCRRAISKPVAVAEVPIADFANESSPRHKDQRGHSRGEG